MLLTQELTQDIITKHGKTATDSGLSEVQIAIFTHRINHLTLHLKDNKKDFSTQRALLTLVGKRRRLLDFLKHRHINRYRAIIKELNIRK